MAEATKYQIGVLIFILLATGGGWMLQEPVSSDICTRSAIRGSWVATDIPDQYYCARENSTKFCQSLADYGGTRNARCWVYTTEFNETITVSDLRQYANFGKISKTETLGSVEYLNDVELNETRNYSLSELKDRITISQNRINVDSSNAQGLSTRARLTFKNVLWDRETFGLYRNGIWQPQIPLTFSGTDVIAVVQGFSEWTIQQTVFDGQILFNGTLLSGNLSKDGDAVGVWFFNNESGLLNSSFIGDDSLNGNDGYDFNDELIFNATGGHDGRGSVEFDALGGGIIIPYDSSLGFSGNDLITISAWVEPRNGQNADARIISQLDEIVLRYLTATDAVQVILNSFTGGTDRVQTFADTVDPGEWTHVVGRYNGTHISIFVNGILNNDVEPSGTYGGLTDDWSIGSRSFAGNFNGSMDDVQIFNRSLSQTEITDLYSGSQKKYIFNGPMNYTDNHSVTESSASLDSNNFWKHVDFTGNTSDMIVKGLNCSTAGCSSSDTVWVLATQSSNRFTFPSLSLPGDYFNISIECGGSKDSSCNLENYSITGNNNTAPSVSNVKLSGGVDNTTSSNLTVTFDVADDENDVVKNITNWKLNTTSIASLIMPFEGGSSSTFTKDYSEFANDGTVNGATWNATGGYDGFGAYEFDGVDDYINVAESSSININGKNEITMGGWVNPFSIGEVGGRLFDKGSTSGYIFFIGGGNQQSCLIDTTVGNTRHETTISTIVYGEWQHWICMYNGSDMKIYKNGIEESTTIESAGTGNMLDDGSNLFIGENEAGTRAFNGTIDQVQIFNRTLSIDQIAALYNNQSHLLSSDETSTEDAWQSCITPNDGFDDGIEVCSNTVTISANNAPSMTSPTITPDPAFFNTTLLANSTVTDSDSDLTTVTTTWFVDSVLVHTQTNTSVTSGTRIDSSLDSNNFSAGNVVLVNFTANDGTVNSEEQNDSITITNIAPSIDSNSITRGADFLVASCTASDADGSIANYTISINGTDESSGNISTCSYTFSALQLNTGYNVTFLVHDDLGLTATVDNITSTRAVSARDWTPIGNIVMKWFYKIEQLWQLEVRQIFIKSDDGQYETKIYHNNSNIQITTNGTGNIIFNNDLISDDWIGNRTCYDSACATYAYNNGTEVVVVD